MATLVVNDILEHRSVKRDGSRKQIAMNVYHWRVSAVTGTPTSDNDALVNLDLLTAVQEKLLMSNKAQYYGSDLRRIFPLPPTLPVSSIVNQGLGSNADDQIPGQVAGLLTLKTALGGPRYRGRKFYAYPPESANDINGVMEGAFNIVMQAVGVAIFASRVVTNAGSTGTITLTPIIWHRATSDYNDVILVQARLYWATLRRRSDQNHDDATPF